jgi:hypothetical protein
MLSRLTSGRRPAFRQPIDTLNARSSSGSTVGGSLTDDSARSGKADRARSGGIPWRTRGRPTRSSRGCATLGASRVILTTRGAGRLDLRRACGRDRSRRHALPPHPRRADRHMVRAASAYDTLLQMVVVRLSRRYGLPRIWMTREPGMVRHLAGVEARSADISGTCRRRHT